jgi:predicted RNA methylase
VTPLDPEGHALEQQVPASERHGRGQYFTPEPLIQFVFDRLEAIGGAPTRNATVLDPACGSGRFLAAAAGRWDLDLRLRGFETDPAALAIASTALPRGDLSPESFLEATGRGDVALVIGNPPYLRSRGAKRDLYVAFVERAFDHLRDGGVLALVLSNAWLDVGYGAAVRAALRSRAAIQWIVESSSERWFPLAKVHTMVLVARKTNDPAERARSRVRFAVTDRPLPAPPVVRREVRQSTLPEDAWGPLLRASDLHLQIRDAPGMVPLGRRFDVRRGFTTNNNGYFYPPRDALEAIESAALAPVFRSPKRVRTVRAVADDLPDRVFLGSDADGPGAAAWIRKHFEGAPPSLGTEVRARQFLLKGYADRFRQPLFDRPVLCDQQLYAVQPHDELRGVPVEAIAGVLNCSWMHLSLEYTGRVNFGDGVLWLGLKDARNRLRIPDLATARRAHVRAVAAAFRRLPDSRTPSASTLPSDPAWAAALADLDAAVSALLGLGPLQMYAFREEWRTRCAIRTR